VVLSVLIALEAAVFYTVNSLGITGLAEVVFKAALPVIVIIGFLVTRLVGNR